MSRLALLCPTRSRPELLKEMLYSLMGTMEDKTRITVYIAVDKDDPLREQYNPVFEEIEKTGLKFVVFEFPRWTVPMAFNMMANGARNHDIYCLAGDDAKYISHGWDEALIKAYDALEDKMHVFSFRDCRDDGVPYPIVTRKWIDEVGYVMCPIFFRWFVDTWIKDLAIYLNRLTRLENYMMIHDKNSPLGAAREKHIETERLALMDRDVYVNEKCKNFYDIEKERLKHLVLA